MMMMKMLLTVQRLGFYKCILFRLNTLHGMLKFEAAPQKMLFMLKRVQNVDWLTKEKRVMSKKQSDCSQKTNQSPAQRNGGS